VLPPATAEVWWARRSDAAARFERVLDDAERERLRAYHRDEDRERFLVGCALAKTAVSGYTGEPAETVRLDRTCDACGKPHGKPRLPGSGLELSVTHSGELVGVAFAAGTPVGLDVEQLTEPARAAELEGMVLSDPESAALARLDSRDRERAFLVAWTRKEALTKAAGAGLRLPIRDVVVSPADEPPRLVAWPWPVEPHTVALFDLDVEPGYVASLATLGECRCVETRGGGASIRRLPPSGAAAAK
jgi:4'-phosphopantetheinyl transferase